MGNKNKGIEELFDTFSKAKPELLRRVKIKKNHYRIVRDSWGDIVVEIKTKDALGKGRWIRVDGELWYKVADDFARLLLDVA